MTNAAEDSTVQNDDRKSRQRPTEGENELPGGPTFPSPRSSGEQQRKSRQLRAECTPAIAEHVGDTYRLCTRTTAKGIQNAEKFDQNSQVQKGRRVVLSADLSNCRSDESHGRRRAANHSCQSFDILNLEFVGRFGLVFGSPRLGMSTQRGSREASQVSASDVVGCRKKRRKRRSDRQGRKQRRRKTLPSRRPHILKGQEGDDSQRVRRSRIAKRCAGGHQAENYEEETEYEGVSNAPFEVEEFARLSASTSPAGTGFQH
ncbi:hypothetical protein TGP89_418850 [Toxoplasma gondii p89]|uniref:Uncharacterized protein n=1 Tax=Toxoplasma gondii p89 TaxID=943119 RepID=A0A086KVH6_TOXGO|nr:hypothetical protein TGP89_418850 [Toxoplasma gondii p89]